MLRKKKIITIIFLFIIFCSLPVYSGMINLTHIPTTTDGGVEFIIDRQKRRIKNMNGGDLTKKEVLKVFNAASEWWATVFPSLNTKKKRIVKNEFTINVNVFFDNTSQLLDVTGIKPSGLVGPGPNQAPQPKQWNMNIGSKDSSMFYWDQTPHQDEEFMEIKIGNKKKLMAAPKKNAANKVDMLTIIKHELGHAMGFSPSYSRYSQKNIKLWNDLGRSQLSTPPFSEQNPPHFVTGTMNLMSSAAGIRDARLMAGKPVHDPNDPKSPAAKDAINAKDFRQGFTKDDIGVLNKIYQMKGVFGKWHRMRRKASARKFTQQAPAKPVQKTGINSVSQVVFESVDMLFAPKFTAINNVSTELNDDGLLEVVTSLLELPTLEENITLLTEGFTESHLVFRDPLKPFFGIDLGQVYLGNTTLLELDPDLFSPFGGFDPWNLAVTVVNPDTGESVLVLEDALAPEPSVVMLLVFGIPILLTITIKK